jgi:ribosomal protein S18 acetylase RimI-like enzyme
MENSEVREMGNEKIVDKVNIRPMVAEDMGFIIDIDQKLTGVQRAIDHTDIVTTDLGEAHDLSFVVELNGTVIGFILARQVYVGEPAVETCAIQIIGVDPAYGRQGIATKLVDYLVQRCNSKKIRSIRVTVSNKDSKMEGFFKHIGFKQAPVKVYNKVL